VWARAHVPGRRVCVPGRRVGEGGVTGSRSGDIRIRGCSTGARSGAESGRGCPSDRAEAAPAALPEAGTLLRDQLGPGADVASPGADVARGAAVGARSGLGAGGLTSCGSGCSFRTKEVSRAALPNQTKHIVTCEAWCSVG
jgi:hypothetical protein